MQEECRKRLLKAFDEGRLEDIDRMLQDVLAKNPWEPEAIQFLASKYLLSHQASYSIALIGRLFEKKKREKRSFVRNCEARLYQTLGRALLAEAHYEAAVVAFKNAIALFPEEAAHHASLGEVCLTLGRYEMAVVALERAKHLAPHQAEIWLFLVQAYFMMGDNQKAALNARHYLKLRPHDSAMRANLGAMLFSMHNLEEAEITLNEALKEGCDTAETYMNLALVTLGLGDVKRACHLFKLSLHDITPHDSAYWCIMLNYGTALYEAALYDEAALCFQQVEEGALENFALEKAQAAFNHAAIFLGRGQWREGWAYFEKRLLFTKPSLAQEFAALPLWNGKEQGGILVLYSEQGLGDMVQFLRYLPKILENHFIYLALSKEQKDFIKKYLFIAPSLKEKILDVLKEGEKIDGRVSFLSLPYYLKESGFSPKPYLYTPQDIAKNMPQERASHKEIIIGLSWEGNKNYAFDRRRSISFTLIEEFFKDFSTIYPVKFISLQKTEQQREKENSARCSWLIEMKNETLGDLAEIICACDMVIAVDSLSAHLAGAFGKKLWLLNRFGGDWRWKHHDLYQDISIFQAHKLAKPQEEWREVLGAVTEALRKIL